MVTCLSPPVFAWPNKSWLLTSALPLKACILSDRNIFCTLWGGKITAGSNAPGAFLVVSRSLAQDVRFLVGQTDVRCVFRYTG